MNYLAALIIVQETVAQKSIVSKLFQKKLQKEPKKWKLLKKKIFLWGFSGLFSEMVLHRAAVFCIAFSATIQQLITDPV